MYLFVALLIGVPLAFVATYLAYEAGAGDLALLVSVAVAAVVGITSAEIEYRRRRR